MIMVAAKPGCFATGKQTSKTPRLTTSFESVVDSENYATLRILNALW